MSTVRHTYARRSALLVEQQAWYVDFDIGARMADPEGGLSKRRRRQRLPPLE
jgi:hypothetical protein